MQIYSACVDGMGLCGVRARGDETHATNTIMVQRFHESSRTQIYMYRYKMFLFACACAAATAATSSQHVRGGEFYSTTKELHTNVLSTATAVLQAIVMAPSIARRTQAPASKSREHTAPSAQQRLQDAQQSAAALLDDNTLEWLLAQPHVADTIWRLLRSDGASSGEGRADQAVVTSPPSAVAAQRKNALEDAGALVDESIGDRVAAPGAKATSDLMGKTQVLPLRKLQRAAPSVHRRVYMGCFADPVGRIRDMQYDEQSQGNGPHELLTFETPEQVVDDCATLCAGFRYMGLQYNAECWCANHYGSKGTSDTCGEEEGERCGDGDIATCVGANAVWDLTPQLATPERPACTAPAQSWPWQGVWVDIGYYRCEVPGCTDSSALNYAPAATMDDGGCRCGEDHCGDTAALLQAFAVDPAAESAWAALHGWGTDSTDLCVWQGVTCANDRVRGVDLKDWRDLRFELSESLSQLQRLEVLNLQGTSLSGTLPESVGEMLGLSELWLGSTSLSGTFPESVGEVVGLSNLWVGSTSISGTLPESVGELAGLSALWLGSTSLSGTIPESVTKMAGLSILNLELSGLSGTFPETGEMAGLSSLLLGSTCLSGTLSESVGEMAGLSRSLDVHSTSLSGTIPDGIGEMVELSKLDLHATRLSGTLPESVGEMAGLSRLGLDSTSLSGTIPNSIGEMTGLSFLGLSSTSMSGTLPESVGQLAGLSYLELHSMRLEDVPNMTQCKSLHTLRLSNNSLTRLPPALPQDLTHLYLNANPLNATASEVALLTGSLPNLHALSIGIISIPIVLEPSWIVLSSGCNVEYCIGTRVTPPNGCQVGRACSWTLQLYDADDQPALTGLLMTDLQIGYNCTCDVNDLCGSRSCEHTAPMVDNRDGTFTATVPSYGWISAQGVHSFRFFHGNKEFQPIMSINGDWLQYDALHNIEFRPRNCSAHSHTMPDTATGSECVCVPGYEPDATASARGVESCHRSCSFGKVVTPQGDGCECGKGSYDTEAFGALLCFMGDWSDPAQHTAFAEVVADRAQGVWCSDCPKDCAVCERGVPTLRAGWRLNTSTTAEFKKLIADGVSGRPQYAFRCPNAEFEAGGCPSLGLQLVDQEQVELQVDVALAESDMVAGQLEAAEDAIEAAQRLETVVSNGLKCLGNHSGRMCAPCSAGFFLKASDDSCVSCTVPDASASSVLSIVLCGTVVMGWGVALWRNRKRIRRVKAEFSTNLKIVLGLMQVLALLKDTLNLVFPPQPQEMLRVVAVFTADFQGWMKLECSGWGWEARWVMTVFGLPLMGAMGVLAQYAWRRRRYGGVCQAKQGAVDSGFLCVMILYPRVSTVVLSALRCRELGPELSVLDADYSVACDHGVEGLAWVMVLVWPVGIPLGLLCLLWREWLLSREQWVESDLDLAATTAEVDHARGACDDAFGQTGSRESLPSSLVEFNAERIRDTFGFCTKDFRPAVFFWEPLDMLRKLALSGLLQFVDRGTAFQVFCGCVLSFGSCAAQIHVAPYAEPTSNLLKVLVEAQIFITFLISFILRVLPMIEAAEPWDAMAYGWVLVVSLSCLLATAVSLTVRQVWQRHHRGRNDMTSDAESGESGEVVLDLSEGLVMERDMGSGGGVDMK